MPFPERNRLAALDRGIRYAAIIALLGLGAFTVAGQAHLQTWLAWKLAASAGVIACGLGIRFALMHFYRTWTEIAHDGASDARERAVRRTYVQATSVLSPRPRARGRGDRPRARPQTSRPVHGPAQSPAARQ